MIVKGFCFVCFDTTVPSSDLQHGGNALNRSWSPTRGRQHIVENLEGIKKKEADDPAEQRRNQRLSCCYDEDRENQPRGETKRQIETELETLERLHGLHVNDISLTFTLPIYIYVTLSNNDYIFFLFY